MISNGAIAFAHAISRVLGWIYFIAWSLSFYPQPIANWRRKSVHGLSYDLPLANVIGLSMYTLFNGMLLFSPLIRDQYAARHPSHPAPTVRANDFVYALHGLIMVIIIYSQFFPAIWGFSIESWQKPSKPMLTILGACVSAAVSSIIYAAIYGNSPDAKGWVWLDVANLLGLVKVLLTIIKYAPQVWVNYKLQSTVGLSILPIQLDFWGGLLSIMQLFLDSALAGDWRGVTGNPAKLGLGNVSILFDVTFMVQHYILYRIAASVDAKIDEPQDIPDEERPLLADSAPDHR